MRSTVNPSTRTSGTAAYTRSSMRPAAASTSEYPARLSTTPPKSDLCSTSGDRIFSTTNPPRVTASRPASPGLRATRGVITGMP